MVLLFTLIELIVVIAILVALGAALASVIGNSKKTKALNNLKKKITSLQFAGTAGADDCAEVKRLLIAAQEAGIEQSVLDDLRENISVLCPDLF
jgi:prepilin-type N-terminal cleavage/methylation domain-containing protein